MFLNFQPAEKSLPLEIETVDSSCCNVKEFLFKPIQFCGRQWEWMKQIESECSASQMVQIALRILALPLLALATFFSGGLGLVAALLPAGDVPTEKRRDIETVIDPELIAKASTDEQVAEKLRERLSPIGCECAVDVSTDESPFMMSLFNMNKNPNSVTRFITIEPTSSCFWRIWKSVQNNFLNKENPSLTNLYLCLQKYPTIAHTQELNEFLETYGRVGFTIDRDLEYIRTWS